MMVQKFTGAAWQNANGKTELDNLFRTQILVSLEKPEIRSQIIVIILKRLSRIGKKTRWKKSTSK